MMKKKMIFALIAAAILTVCAGCSKKADTPDVPKDLFASLDTVDFEGNRVTADVFKENDLTVINTWATWCGPCVGEIPELQELSEELKQEGTKVAIKGMVAEDGEKGLQAGLSENERTLVKEVLSKTGATYQQLLVSEDLAISALSRQAGFPTTYFVDSEGQLVGDPVMFSQDKDGWRKVIEERLKEVTHES